jgi:hypothetical protein
MRILYATQSEAAFVFARDQVRVPALGVPAPPTPSAVSTSRTLAFTNYFATGFNARYGEENDD